MVFAETFGNFAFAITARVLGLRDLGPAISPMNSFLVLTGIETLPLRMARHSDNTKALPSWLQGAAGSRLGELCRPVGAANIRAAEDLAERRGRGAHLRPEGRLRRRHQAGVESGCSRISPISAIGSLIIHPASTTHRQLTAEQRKAAGAGDDVVRLSVGLEDKEDIIADLEQAMTAL